MAPHVIWTEFSPNRKASGVRHATGYPIEVLEHAWDKYGSALIRAVYRYPGFEVIARARDRRKLGKFVADALFNGLYWIHHYPSIAGAAWPTPVGKKFYECVMPVGGWACSPMAPVSLPVLFVFGFGGVATALPLPASCAQEQQGSTAS